MHTKYKGISVKEQLPPPNTKGRKNNSECKSENSLFEGLLDEYSPNTNKETSEDRAKYKSLISKETAEWFKVWDENVKMLGLKLL